MAKRAHASRFHGGIPDDRPRTRRPEGPARQRPASPPGSEWLAARPGPHTPGEIAKDLGRSSGAVGNALTTLADRSEADCEPGNPIRYQANATTAAAAAITPKAPSPPKRAPAPLLPPGRPAEAAGRAMAADAQRAAGALPTRGLSPAPSAAGCPPRR